ncbi:YciI family protein [Kordiimonas lacus]|uniref:YCII-related domain-containing protein n=1 Tax=Kordiimonas lacus TaxID=637679 RepID=A0A1G7B6P0_9PROT|nr:hypothetical protein [Kordiimonas lacus]SDE22530.1 hypothetical protein SAMN04488071_2379 [Kordiimonas lacus]
MFIVFLKFTGDKSRAPDFMAGHNAWIRDGFANGYFLMVGSLQSGAGGAILAHNITHADLESFIAEDPFVAEGIVTPEVVGVTPGRTDTRLDFLVPTER